MAYLDADELSRTRQQLGCAGAVKGILGTAMLIGLVVTMNRLSQQDNSTPFGVWDTTGAVTALEIFMESGKHAWGVMVPEEPGHEPTKWSVWLMPPTRWREFPASQRKIIMEMVAKGKCPYAVRTSTGSGGGAFDATFERFNWPEGHGQSKRKKKAA